MDLIDCYRKAEHEIREEIMESLRLGGLWFGNPGIDGAMIQAVATNMLAKYATRPARRISAAAVVRELKQAARENKRG